MMNTNIPEGSGMPPCALQLAACGSAVCLCAAASVASLVCIRHGGEPQATLEESISSAQHSVAPPSLNPQLSPPHEPHELEQHRMPDSSGTPPRAAQAKDLACAAEASTCQMHGGLPHSMRAAIKLSEQHSSAPGKALSRLSQPVPPHVPHEAEQQDRPNCTTHAFRRE